MQNKFRPYLELFDIHPCAQHRTLGLGGVPNFIPLLSMQDARKLPAEQATPEPRVEADLEPDLQKVRNRGT